MVELIKILVVDDHPVVRDGLISMLRTQSDFQVVGEAGSGTEAVRSAVQLAPEVILLDLEMPDLDGVEVIKQVKARLPEVKVVVFTAFDRDEQIVAAIRSGAEGYLLKGAPREQVFRALRIARSGGSLIEPMIASKLLRQVRGNPSALTPKQLEVLALVAEGHSNARIAKHLFVTERTVKFHVSGILSKLGASNRTQAAALARERGLLPS